MTSNLINANPTIHTTNDDHRKRIHRDDDMENEELDEPIDTYEIYDLIRSITDPEHPLTLEQLAVVSPDQIVIDNQRNWLTVEFTPTVSHCSLATLIGLSLRVRLLRALPERLKVDIVVKKGTHQSEMAVNKQLNDKERVAAALENTHLLDVVNNCLKTANLRGQQLMDVTMNSLTAKVNDNNVSQASMYMGAATK